MRRLLPAARRRRHLESPQVDAFAAEPGVRDGGVAAPRFEGEHVRAAARADVAQTTAFA